MVHLVNKQDYLSSGKAKTGYHTLKDEQMVRLSQDYNNDKG